MTVMYHPNKIAPERFRVLDKELKEQKYFSIKEHGLEKAKALAETFQAELDKKKKYRKLKKELGINKIFRDDGSIKGVRRHIRQRKGRPSYECFAIQVTVAPKTQKSTEILLNGKTFEAAYKQLRTTLLQMYGIDNSREIASKFVKAKHFYW